MDGPPPPTYKFERKTQQGRKRSLSQTTRAPPPPPKPITVPTQFGLCHRIKKGDLSVFAKLILLAQSSYPEQYLSLSDHRHHHACDTRCLAVQIEHDYMCIGTGNVHRCEPGSGEHCSLKLSTREHLICPLSQHIFESDWDASDLFFGGHLTTDGRSGLHSNEAAPTLSTKPGFDHQFERSEIDSSDKCSQLDQLSEATTELAEAPEERAVSGDAQASEYNTRLQSLFSRCRFLVHRLMDSDDRRELDRQHWRKINENAATQILKYTTLQTRLDRMIDLSFIINTLIARRDDESIAAHIQHPPYTSMPEAWMTTITDFCAHLWMEFTARWKSDVEKQEYRYDDHIQAVLFAFGNGISRLLVKIPGLEERLPSDTTRHKLVYASDSVATGKKRDRFSRNEHTFARLLRQYRQHVYDTPS